MATETVRTAVKTYTPKPTFGERMDDDRCGLNYGIYFRNHEGAPVCIAAFNGRIDRDNALAAIQVVDMYFAGDIGDTI